MKVHELREDKTSFGNNFCSQKLSYGSEVWGLVDEFRESITAEHLNYERGESAWGETGC